MSDDSPPVEAATPAPSPTPDPAPATPAAPEAPASAATDKPDEPAAAETKPKKKGRGKWIALGITGGVLLIAVILFFWLSTPPDRAEFNDPVDAKTRSTNAALYAALVAANISDPFVDTNGERAYVVYSLAAEDQSQAETFQRFVIGVAADASPESKEIHAFQYFGDAPHELWIVQMSDFLAYVSGEKSAQDLETSIVKVPF